MAHVKYVKELQSKLQSKQIRIRQATHKGPILFKKLIILIKDHKIINKHIKIVNLGILKVKTWFGDKDLFS